jgi:hypothetical protein
MADIALSAKMSADRELRVVESWQQFTAPCVEAIAEGDGIRFDATTGKWTKANATVAGEARVTHIATHRAAAGQSLTGIKKGIVDGFVLDALNYDVDIFLSNTDGRLGDVAGTVSKIVGRVIPGFATTTGTAADKLLLVDL